MKSPTSPSHRGACVVLGSESASQKGRIPNQPDFYRGRTCREGCSEEDSRPCGVRAGHAEVTTSRNTYNLHTAGQIQDMAVGNPARSENGTFALNYDIKQSNDLVNWKRAQASLLPPTSLPTDKAFVRIRAQ
jgi:hypothetical protein